MRHFGSSILAAGFVAALGAGVPCHAGDAGHADLLLGWMFPESERVSVYDATVSQQVALSADYHGALVPALRFVLADSRRWPEFDVELNGFQVKSDGVKTRVIAAAVGFGGSFDLRRREGGTVWRGTAGLDVGIAWSRVEIESPIVPNGDLPQATLGIPWWVRFGVRRTASRRGPDWIAECRWASYDVTVKHESFFTGQTTQEVRTSVRGFQLLTGMAVRF